MKHKLILSIVALILLIGITGANKDKVVSLFGYEEECLEYQEIDTPYLENQVLISSWSGNIWVDTKTIHHPYTYGNRTIVKHNITQGNCIKYYLVRYVRGDGK